MRLVRLSCFVLIAVFVLGCGPVLIGAGLSAAASGGGGGPAPNDATLRGLTLSSAVLAPSFRGDVLDYTATTLSTVTSVAVTVVATNPDATIVLEGQPLSQSVPSSSFDLIVGLPRTFTIAVTSADGTAGRSYTVTTTRQAAPSLADLSLSDGGSVVPLAFQPGGRTYTLTLDFLIPTVLVTPTAEQGVSIAISSSPIASSGSIASGETREVSLVGNEQNTVIVQVAKGQGSLRETRDYVLTIFRKNVTDFEQRAYAKAGNRDAGDQFGSAVAVSGNLIAVGAPTEDSNASGVSAVPSLDNSLLDSGAVYVYEPVGPGWALQAYVKASAAANAADAAFGTSIALQNDMLAVGAPGVESGRGMVFVYHRLPAGGWDPVPDVVTAGPFRDAADRFGQAIALDGDTLVVGARGEDSGGTGVEPGGSPDNSKTNSGAVYVFVRSDGQWHLQAFLKASNTDALDLFGSAVAVSGDRIAVGAPEEDSPATTVGGFQGNSSLSDLNSGAVYVFTRSEGVWSQQEYMKGLYSAFAPFEVGGRFGHTVALFGSTLAVGANLDNGPEGANSQSGAVYVFVDNGGWSLEQHLTASNRDDGDQFGCSIALFQDTLAIGAREEDGLGTLVGSAGGNGASNSGAAYVFLRSQGLWQQGAYVKASNTAVNDNYGGAVAVRSNTLVVGASNEDGNSVGVTIPPTTWPGSSSLFPSSGAMYVLN